MKRLLVVALPVVLSACAFAPGQHVRVPGSLTSWLTPGGSSEGEVAVIPLSARVVALSGQPPVPALPEALTAYQPPVYRVGPGDLLRVTIWEHPQLTNPGAQQSLENAGQLVHEDGSLYFPYAGKVKVAGMTLEELRVELTRRLSRFLTSPQLDVSVARAASQRVFISGAFEQKLPLALNNIPLNLPDALGRAGLINDEADLSAVTLTRNGQRYVLDIEELARVGAPLDRIALQAGDALHVPFNDQKKIYVMGELNRPQSLTYRTASISLADAIGRSGSVNQNTARAKSAYVIRNSSPENDLVTNVAIYQLDLNDPTALVLSDKFMLQRGDVIYIGSPGIVRWNRFISQLFPSLGFLATTNTLNNN